MTWALKQTRRFARAYRKLDDNVARDVDAATGVVAADPTVGERKKGDLADLFV
ncbi:MAG: type II toxin-antitoxin system RelE/ParE family toxin, partial [Gammaproteobacteria bacterium]